MSQMDEPTGRESETVGDEQTRVLLEGARSAAAPSGRKVGSYELIRELGAGGQGYVYLAKHLRLGRNVALKILPDVHALSRDARLRFEREAEVASRLDHPCICTVYEMGEDDGIPFIAMRYVEGDGLEQCSIVPSRPMAGRRHCAPSMPCGCDCRARHSRDCR
jgi:serine/threonine protein kinase